MIISQGIVSFARVNNLRQLPFNFTDWFPRNFTIGGTEFASEGVKADSWICSQFGNEKLLLTSNLTEDFLNEC